MSKQESILDIEQLPVEVQWETEERFLWSSAAYFPFSIFGKRLLNFIAGFFMIGFVGFLISFFLTGILIEITDLVTEYYFLIFMLLFTCIQLVPTVLFLLKIDRKIQFGYSSENLVFWEKKLFTTNLYQLPFAQIENIMLDLNDNGVGNIHFRPKKNVDIFPPFEQVPQAKELYLELKEMHKESVLLLDKQSANG